MAAYRRTLNLTEAQAHQLRHHRDHDPRPYVRERCAALLKIADGPDRKVVAMAEAGQLYVHRLAHDWKTLRQRVNAFLDQFANGSHALLRYVGLAGEGKLARALQLS